MYTNAIASKPAPTGPYTHAPLQEPACWRWRH